MCRTWAEAVQAGTASAATTTRAKMAMARFMGPPGFSLGFGVPLAPGHGRDVVLEALEGERQGPAELGAAISGHEQFGHGDAVGEVLLGPDAAPEGLDHVPVL